MKLPSLRSPRAAALGLLACAALAAPAAAADPPSATYAQPSTAKIGDTPADYPGMPDAPAAGEPTGFDWPSAAIGAAGAGLLFVIALGGASVLPRRRTSAARGHRRHAGA